MLTDRTGSTLPWRNELRDWRVDGRHLVRAVEADSFAAGIRLVDAVAEAADDRDHHPDIDIRWTTVTFRLSTPLRRWPDAEGPRAGRRDRPAGHALMDAV